MPRISRIAAIALVLYAADARAANVTLTGTLRYPFGISANEPATCLLTLTLNKLGTTNTTSQDFGSVPFKYQITNGFYRFVVQPNDALTPSGTSYSAQFSQCLNGGSWSEIWVVPSSPASTTIGAVRSNVVPTPLVMFQPQQIVATNIPNGQYCINVANGAVIGLVPCSTTGGLTWSTLTSLTWPTINPSLWGVMTQ